MIDPGPVLSLLAEKQAEVLALRERIRQLEQALRDAAQANGEN